MNPSESGMDFNMDTKMDSSSDLGPTNQPVHSNKVKFVAIHLGAKNGKYDEQSSQLAKEICETVMSNTKIGSAVDAVVQLVKIMEDNPRFNCGYGSNLTIRGEVECDASLMCDRTKSWASVGAVSGCRNPILLAKSLFDIKDKPRPLGLIQPNFLIGSGASSWMREECSHLVVPPSRMISTKAIDKYQKLKSDYDIARKSRRRDLMTNPNHSHSTHEPAATSKTEDYSQLSENMMVDLETVGAVAIDMSGNFATAISSGGLWLKLKGRIGQAAIPGAGCWCEDSIAVTTTGVGEYISSNLMAKKFQDYLQHARACQNGQAEPQIIISEVFRQCYKDLHSWAESSQIKTDKLPVAFLTLCNFNCNTSSATNDDNYLLSIGQNTQSMCIAYMTSHEDKATAKICQLDDNEISNSAFLVNVIDISGRTNTNSKRLVLHL